MDKIFGELKLEPASQNSDNWLADNVFHPFANGTGVIQIYDTLADKPLEIYQVPQAKTFSTDWCVQAMSSAAGAIVPFVVAGKLTGAGMQAIGSKFAAEGVAAKFLASEHIAQIAGAGLYTFAQKPAEGHSRTAAAAGTMAGFAFFSAGNALLGKALPSFANPAASAFANGAGRFAVGAAAGLGSYESANLVSGLQGMKHEANWDERWQAMAHGGFVNVALPVVQDRVSKTVESLKRETARPLEQKIETPQSRLAAGQDIVSTSAAFEKWMSDRIKVVPEDLAAKHAEMTAEPFKFLRGTYYRWAEKYPELLPELQKAPVVNSVGDLHAENFGTWTDRRGRMVWGVNDFDESFHLPYTNDLVRVVTSVNLLKQSGQIKMGLNEAAAEVMAGYNQGLKDGGKPFVLADNAKLASLANKQQPEAGKFWRKIEQQIAELPAQDVPSEAMTALKSILPDADLHKVGSRQAGLGSLGRQRIAALGEYQGEKVAAEVKTVLPSSNYFASGKPGERSHLAEIMGQSVREVDPATKVQNAWVARSLTPQRFKIELPKIGQARDEATLLRAMGYETANVHLGTKNAGSAILADLAKRDPNWLVDAAKTMTNSTIEDHNIWKDRSQ